MAPWMISLKLKVFALVNVFTMYRIRIINTIDEIIPMSQVSLSPADMNIDEKIFMDTIIEPAIKSIKCFDDNPSKKFTSFKNPIITLIYYSPKSEY
ncbi:hypothetical protein CFB3_37910 [Clostridium folliculivorans]|nr:hypothetical protein CFB3_37910 [Clostridium folliculivorans]